MFAGLLNKGLRGSMVLLVLGLVTGWLLHFFAVRPLELEFYPNLFYNYFTHQISNPALITTLNIIFLAAGLLLVSYMVQNEEIVDKQNYFPVFLYLLIGLCAINPFQVTSQNLSNIFVLYSLSKLLDLHRREYPLRHIFEAAFWLCCSAFITISTIITVPVFFVALTILRPFNWREWANALLGFFVPIFIFECLAYLSEFHRWYLFTATEHYFENLRTPFYSEYYLPFAGCLIILFLASLLFNLVNGAGNTVRKQRTKNILLWLTIFSVPGFFSGGANTGIILLTFAVPLCFYIGDFLFRIRRIKITNTLLVFLLASAAIIFAGTLGLL